MKPQKIPKARVPSVNLSPKKAQDAQLPPTISQPLKQRQQLSGVTI